MKDIGICKDFLDKIPEAQAMKTNINKWNYVNLQCITTVKKSLNKVKWQPTKWKKMLANYAPYKGLISRIFSYLRSSTTKINNQVKTWANSMNSCFSSDEIQSIKREKYS